MRVTPQASPALRVVLLGCGLLVFLIGAALIIAGSSAEEVLRVDGHDMFLLSKGAVDRVTVAAEGGDVSAQTTLGTAYLQGERLRKNVTAAVYWFEKVAGSDPKECEQLRERMRAILNERSEMSDAETNHRLEAEYIDLVAKRLALEQAFIGLIYVYSGAQDTSHADATRAVQYIIQGTECGFPAAKRALGIARVFSLLGFPQNRAHGVRLLHEAAAQGDHGAEYILGRLYASGAAGERDLDYAEYWFRRAALHHPNEQAKRVALDS